MDGLEGTPRFRGLPVRECVIGPLVSADRRDVGVCRDAVPNDFFAKPTTAVRQVDAL